MAKITYKLATRPEAQKPLTSVLADSGLGIKTQADIQGATTGRVHGASSFIEVDKHPIPAALLAAGFTYKETAEAKGVTAHGYAHKDGRAALFTHNGRPGTEAWRLKIPGVPNGYEGVKAEDLVLALTEKATKTLTAPTPALPPSNVLSAIRALKGDYDLHRFKGDSNDVYGARMRLLKLLRSTDKVTAKSNTYKALVTELCAAVGVPATAALSLFGPACTAALKAADKAERQARKAEEVKIAKTLKATLPERLVVDGKPILPRIKKKTQRQLAAEREELRAELARKRRHALDTEAATPIAKPKPDAAVKVVAADLRILEDPSNGIAFLQVERENSQGAICVYNNGSRVAAGVVPPEVLKTLRQVQLANILEAANQLLTPIVSSVVVTPVAERHLTAVLHCKELIPMATKKTAAPVEETKKQKFAPPAGVPAKKAGKAEEAKPAKKAAKKDASAPTERKSSLFRLRNETKAVWSAFGTQRRQMYLLTK